MTSASRKAALTDDETLAEVIECLAGNITIETQGACDPKMLFNLLVRAACNRDSVENTAKILQQVPCGNNIRYHLDKLNNFEQLETQLNRAIKSQIPSGLKNGCHAVAIDLNLIPYYGEPSLLRASLYLSQSGKVRNLFILCLCHNLCHQERKARHFRRERCAMPRYQGGTFDRSLS